MEAAMALKKNVETKRIVAYLLKVGAAILSSALLFACGGDSGNSSKAENEDEGREVATLVDMGRCTSEREGDTVYVAEKLTDYLCRNGSWIDLSKQDYLESSSSVVPDSSSVIPSDSEESSSSAVPGSSSQGNNTSDTLVVKKRSILGVAQKGPFKFGSPVYLRELSEENLDQTGMVYEDEISSNKGDFVIPNVNLNSPYAEVEVRGLYRNEVTGEYSKDSISLLALTDLKTDSRTKVNVNLLTHLEYKRAMYLVRKGYSVYAAKKQADQEIMTAFELPTTVKYSEDLSVFEDSEDDNVDYANASLMMLNLLFLGNRSDAEIKNAIDNFIADIEKDGSWEDDSTKAVMADFATEIDGDEIRANVKAWNILDIPKFEGQMEMFWNNVYGLGGCTSVRSGVITKNQNKYSKNFEVYYKCSEGRWVKATQFEYDTYGWSAGVVGEVKEGNVTDAKYVYRDGKWNQASALEDGLGSCLAKNEGTILTYGPSYGLDYYVCKSRQWTKLTVAEADVYGWSAGADGEVKKGSYTDTKYVYRNGVWSTASTVEAALGSCTVADAGTVKKNESTYYVCKSSAWTIATVLEYDTYGWTAGEVGEVKKGNVTDAKYIYRNGKWNTAGAVETALGSCTAVYAGTVKKNESTYYICKANEWAVATVLEYDAYGLVCSKDGAIKDGVVNADNKYVCDGEVFREATTDELNRNLGCTSYTQGAADTISSNTFSIDRWICTDKWSYEKIDFRKTMTDARDGQTYKIVTIGTQTWMAENLNYRYTQKTSSLDSSSFCYNNKFGFCAKYGRLYLWSAAMDSAAVFSTVGRDCGYGKTCSPSGTVRGVCPEGWHLPNKDEWNTLFTAVGGSSVAGVKLKSVDGWEYESALTKGTDAYGFSALPAGFYYSNSDNFVVMGYRADFWSSTEGGRDLVYRMALEYNYEDANLLVDIKDRAMSVRCLQD